jgi:ribonuclease HII
MEFPPDAKVIIGVDEVGRGAIAGPLVVVAVAFLRDDPPPTASYRTTAYEKLVIVGDSKSFRHPIQRQALDVAVRGTAQAVILIERSPSEIDAKLISVVHQEAITLAIARCVETVTMAGVYTRPSDFFIVVDGETPISPEVPCPAIAIPGADASVWQVGAASVVAKVARDSKMIALQDTYPEYDFAQHKGYPVPAHKKALKKHGPCAEHRKTCLPVILAGGSAPGFEEFF